MIYKTIKGIQVKDKMIEFIYEIIKFIKDKLSSKGEEKSLFGNDNNVLSPNSHRIGIVKGDNTVVNNNNGVPFIFILFIVILGVVVYFSDLSKSNPGSKQAIDIKKYDIDIAGIIFDSQDKTKTIPKAIIRFTNYPTLKKVISEEDGSFKFYIKEQMEEEDISIEVEAIGYQNSSPKFVNIRDKEIEINMIQKNNL